MKVSWTFVIAAVVALAGEASAQEVHGRVGPDAILAGETVTVFADFVDFDPALTVSATADASALGGPASLPLVAPAAGATLSASFSSSASLATGTHAIPIAWTASDGTSGTVGVSVTALDRARCVPAGYGVPYLDGPPRWRSWTGDSRPVLDTVTDPRWNGATAAGGSWQHGSATEPVNFRALRSGGHVYLQWVVNVSADNQRRVLYVGFRDRGKAYIVRFNGNSPTTTPATANPSWCDDSFEVCEPALHYKVFVEDPNHVPGTCGTATNATRFVQYPGTGTVTDVDWITDTARYYTLGDHSWAFQVRVPVSAAPASLDEGLTERFAMWFEARPEVADLATTYAWPQAITDLETCEGLPGDPEPVLVHAGTASSTQMAPVRMLDTVGVARCTVGLRLARGEVGVVQSIPSGSTADDVLLTSAFRAPASGGPIDNILIARPENPTGADIPAASVRATFRLARWGIQPLDQQWGAIPGGSDVALAGDIPSAGSSGSGKGRFQFTWPLTVTDGTTFAGSNRHQCMLVEMKVVGADANGAHVDVENVSVYRNMDFGTMSVFPQPAFIDVRGLPTVTGQTHHEIYLVAVPRNLPRSVPAGTTGVSLVQDTARAVAGEVRAPYAHALELDPDLPQHPGKLPDEADELGVDEMWRTALADNGDAIGRAGRLGKHAGKVGPVGEIMAPRARALHDVLTGAANAPLAKDAAAQALTLELAQALPPAELARVVPTIEVYAYYRTGEVVGADGRAQLRPMASFSFFLSHEGELSGTTWVLDGVEPVDPANPDNNVFRVRIPVDKPGRHVRLRVQAKEPGDSDITADRIYPCTCCNKSCPAAYQVSNAGLLALAVWFSTRRRRRPRIGV